MATEKTYKTGEAVKRHLRQQLKQAANGYALELHNMWGMEVTGDDYWIGGEEEPCGAPYQLRTLYFIPLDEMQYIVDHDISREEYDEYNDYLQRLGSIGGGGFDIPGFREWREHPEQRIPADTLERLQMLQDQLDKEIENVIKKQKGF